MRFVVLRSPGMRKFSLQNASRVGKEELNQPTCHPDFEGHQWPCFPLVSLLLPCPGILRTINRRNTETEHIEGKLQCPQTLGLASGNACTRKSEPEVFPHRQKVRSKRKKESLKGNGGNGRNKQKTQKIPAYQL